MKQNLVKIAKISSTAVVAGIVLLAFLLVGVRLFGFQVYVVLSGSMEPTYQTGSVIYVKDVDPMTLQEGDPVTFRVSDDTLVTHRIIEIVPDSENADNQYFRTKGDANEMEDGVLIACDQVVGKPMFTIPQLGYLAAYIQQPPGMYIAISVAAGLMLFVMLADSLAEEKTEDSERNKAGKHGRRNRKKTQETGDAPEDATQL